MDCSRSGWGRARVRNARHTGAALVVTALTQLCRSQTHAERPPRPTTHNPPASRLRGIMVCCGCRVLHPMQLRTATYSASGGSSSSAAGGTSSAAAVPRLPRGSRPLLERLDFILARLDALSVLSDQLVQDLAGGFDDLLRVLVLDVEETADFVGLRIIKLLGAAEPWRMSSSTVSSSIPGRRTSLTAGSLCDLRVAADAEDVDPPASELGSEANILPASADRLGQLVVWDDELH